MGAHMTHRPFTLGDYARFVARLVGPRHPRRPVNDWMESTRPRMQDGSIWPNMTKKRAWP